MSGDPRVARLDVGLLQQAVLWRALALLFESPEPWRLEELEQIQEQLDDEDLQQAINVMREMTGSQYIDTLGPGGLVSPREVAYRGREDPGRILADIASFHEAFLFHAQAQDPQDHVARECDFVSYLFLKEAYARAQGNDDAATICREGRDGFFREHLRTFVAPMEQRLAATQHPVLAPAARTLHALVGDPEASPTLEEGVAGELDDLNCGGCALQDPPPGHWIPPSLKA